MGFRAVLVVLSIVSLVEIHGTNALHSRTPCPLGYYGKLKTHRCKKVSWSAWSSWTKCISTNWGGISLRDRLCKSGDGRIRSGFCVGHGSEHKSCSRFTKDLKIRKNVRLLTAEEQHDLIQAMTKFKKDKSPKGFVAITQYHGWPFTCSWMKYLEGHEDGHCSYHNSPFFLQWHRIFVVQLELGLNRYMRNKTLGIPYWDWTEPYWTDFPKLFRNPIVYDPILRRRVSNPFYRTQLYGHKKYKGKIIYTHRNISHKGIHQWQKFLASTIMALESNSYNTFDETLEDNAHAQVHYCSCKQMTGLCGFSMPTTTYSSWDPLFLLHHGMIDRVYAIRKAITEAAHLQDWTAHRIIGSYLNKSDKPPSLGRKVKARRESKHLRKIHKRDINSHLKLSSFVLPMSPFVNNSINPFTITRGRKQSSMKYGYYYKNLYGYYYDNLNLSGRNWRILVKDLSAKYVVGKGRGWKKDLTPLHSHLYPEFGIITKKNCMFNIDYCNAFYVPRT